MVAMAIRSGLWLRPFFLSSRSSRGRRDPTPRGRDRESRLRAGGAGAKRLRKSKRIGLDEGRPVYESKKRVAALPSGGRGGVGGRASYRKEGARGRTAARWKGIECGGEEGGKERQEKGGETKRGERATPGAILLEFK